MTFNKKGITTRIMFFSSCTAVSAIRKHVVRIEESRGKNPKPNVSKLDQIQQQSSIILPVTVVSRKTGGGKGGGGRWHLFVWCQNNETDGYTHEYKGIEQMSGRVQQGQHLPGRVVEELEPVKRRVQQRVKVEQILKKRLHKWTENKEDNCIEALVRCCWTNDVEQ